MYNEDSLMFTHLLIQIVFAVVQELLRHLPCVLNVDLGVKFPAVSQLQLGAQTHTHTHANERGRVFKTVIVTLTQFNIMNEYKM